MSQIRIIIYFAIFIFRAGLALAEENERLINAEACFDIAIGRDRLQCYDQSLGRPFGRTQLPVEDLEQPNAGGLSVAAPYLNSSISLGAVQITLSEDGLRLPFDAEAYELLDPQSDGDRYREMSLKTNLDMALESDIEAGEPAILLLSCRQDITELRLIWDESFSGTQRQVDFYAGQTLSDRARISHAMRIDPAGNTLEMPRGLPSIRLVSDLLSGPHFQVAVNRPNEPPLFAIFDTSDLRRALPMQARFCYWSSNTVRE